jgi:hypothetical protein
MALDDARVEIGFKKGSFYSDRLREEANREAAVKIVHSFFGKDLKVAFSKIDSAGWDKHASGEEEGETDRDRWLRKEVLENPIVKDALEIFDGEIEEIKVGNRFES